MSDLQLRKKLSKIWCISCATKPKQQVLVLSFFSL
jgi:hypothetical protein